MNQRIPGFLLSTLLLWTGCLQELEEPNRFIKVIGDQTTSIGEKIIELPDGNIAVVGKTGRLSATYDPENYVDDLEDQSGSVSILDAYGNLIRPHILFPIEAFKTKYLHVTNSANGMILKDLIPLSDGTYIALTQFRNVDYTVITEQGQFEFENGFGSLIIKLDSNFEVENILSVNGEEGWTGDFHIRASVKKLPFSDDLIVLTTNFGLLSPNPIGYSLLRLNKDLDTLDFQAFNRNGIKSAEGFDLDPSGYVVMIGQRNDRLWTYSVPVDGLNFDLEEYSDIDINGTFGWNNNEHFIISTENGATLLYTDAPYAIKFVQINDAMRPFTDPVMIGGYSVSDEPKVGNYPRAFVRTQNGDYLVLVIHIHQEEDVPNWSTLHRLDSNGKELFQLKFDGSPGDIIETSDGSILVLTNPDFNGSLYKMTLTKLSADGKLR